MKQRKRQNQPPPRPDDATPEDTSESVRADVDQRFASIDATLARVAGSNAQEYLNQRRQTGGQ